MGTRTTVLVLRKGVGAMRVRYHDLGVDREKVEHLLERELRVIERQLEDIDDDLKALDVTIEHFQRSDTYEARLRLSVPDRELAARGEGVNPLHALRDAFAELREELERYLAKMRGEDFKRRARQHPSLAKPVLPPEEPES